MTSLNTATNVNLDDLVLMVTRKVRTERGTILPFTDLTEFVTEFLKMVYQPSSNLVAAGPVSPEIAIAADRAEYRLVETLAKSPFTGDPKIVLQSITHDHDVVYLANPNRITGANYAISDIEELAQAVPHGALIVDEYYFDFFGLSAQRLLDVYTNIIVLRSFTASFGIYSSDAGFAIASRAMTTAMKNMMVLRDVSPTIRRTILTVMGSDEAMSFRLQEIHDEALRLTTTLTKLGVQCRITATDFLLLRVASPKDSGNFLATSRVSIENLDGYPGMKNYLRYRIESPFSNEKLIAAFSKMPANFYKMKSTENRAATIHHTSEDTPAINSEAVEKMLSGPVKQRGTKPELVEK